MKLLLILLSLYVANAMIPEEISSHEHLVHQLNALPEVLRHATKKALKNIPSHDAKFINIDDYGEIYYRDPPIYDYEHLMNDMIEPFYFNTSSVVAERIPMTQLPRYHSRPGSQNVLYLDFDGEVISGRAWNGGATITCLPFDIDSNPGDLSPEELNRIRDIFERVTEDYSLWDIDVTTERPLGFTETTAHVVITVGNTVTPSGTSAGGIAYLNVFKSAFYQFYSPAFVYFNNLGLGNPKYVAEAVSHEAGHNFGLSHDGTSTVGYYRGHGTGPTGWAPIMGVSYYQPVTQWSKGEYPDANNLEDDIAIITSKIGGIGPKASNLISGINPGCSSFYYGSNIIKSTYDANGWTVNLPNTVSVSVTVTAYRSTWNINSFYRGNNLDTLLIVLKGNARVERIDTIQPSSTPDIQYDKILTPDLYRFIVASSDDPTIPYSRYGSLGQYNITICVKSLP